MMQEFLAGVALCNLGARIAPIAAASIRGTSENGVSL